jgi:hypothetical protein
MNRALISVSFAILAATFGQRGLMHEALLNFGILTLLGLPGFDFAVLLGLEDIRCILHLLLSRSSFQMHFCTSSSVTLRSASSEN